jgi:serine/threonine-protein kinase
MMNERLPTGDIVSHFRAQPSRDLIKAVDIATGLQRTLRNSNYAFALGPYYADIIEKPQLFLSINSGRAVAVLSLNIWIRLNYKK